MNYKNLLFGIITVISASVNGHAQDSEQEVLQVIDEFFYSMEKKDATVFNSLFLENAHAYSVREKNDSTIVRNSILKAINSKNTLKERLREQEIAIHIYNNIATVWPPYDFWIDNKHSHCGYEVFTLIKKGKDWKIASLTYSVEEDTCKQ